MQKKMTCLLNFFKENKSLWIELLLTYVADWADLRPFIWRRKSTSYFGV